MGEAVAVEVGPQPEDDGHAVGCLCTHLVDEPLTFGLVLAQGEQLLELVDDDQSVGAQRPLPRLSAQFSQRLRGRRQVQHAGSAGLPLGQRAPGDGRGEPGPQQRRLADAGRADHHRRTPGRTGIGQQPEQIRDRALTAEEPVRVLRTERRETRIGAGPGPRSRCQGEQHTLGLQGLVTGAGEGLARPLQPALQTTQIALAGPQPLGKRSQCKTLPLPEPAQLRTEGDVGGRAVVSVVLLGLVGCHPCPSRSLHVMPYRAAGPGSANRNTPSMSCHRGL